MNTNFAHPNDQDPNVRLMRRIADLERTVNSLAKKSGRVGSGLYVPETPWFDGGANISISTTATFTSLSDTLANTSRIVIPEIPTKAIYEVSFELLVTPTSPTGTWLEITSRILVENATTAAVIENHDSYVSAATTAGFGGVNWTTLVRNVLVTVDPNVPVYLHPQAKSANGVISVHRARGHSTFHAKRVA